MRKRKSLQRRRQNINAFPVLPRDRPSNYTNLLPLYRIICRSSLPRCTRVIGSIAKRRCQGEVSSGIRLAFGFVISDVQTHPWGPSFGLLLVPCLR